MSDVNDMTDETLTAYLDGELTAKEAGEVEAALASSPELQARLAALDVPLGALRDGMDMALAEAPKVPEMPVAVVRASGAWQWGAIAAALAVGVALGGQFARQSATDWVDVVANYQSLYVTETLAAPALPSAVAIQKVGALSADLGVELWPLLDLDAIEFRRAQMLGLEGEPLVQMAYLAGAVPVAICITRIESGDTSVNVDQRFGMQAAHWTENGYGYLVIGGDDADLIRSVADQVRAAL